MANLYEKASLVLPTSPAYKDGAIQAYKPLTSQGTFDFSRGSNLAATRVDANGLIEKGRENLFVQSNQFDTTWSSINASETSGQSGYDGTNNAWAFTDNTANDIHSLAQYGKWTTSVCTGSIYIKAGSLSKFYVSNGSSGIGVFFNLSNGSVEGVTGAVIAQSITSVGGDWYRLSVTMQSAGTFLIGTYQTFVSGDYNASIRYTGTGTGTIYIQDSQLEQGLIATDYIETGASTAQAGILEDMPRLDYSGGASCPSLLLEPQRSNSVLHSELISTYFFYTNASATNNATTSPEGVVNAASVIPNVTNGIHQIASSNISASGSFTLSAFVKAGELNKVAIRESNATGAYASFDLSTGTKIEDNVSGDAFIEPFENDWYRIGVTYTYSGNIRLGINILDNSYTTGNPSSGTTYWSSNGTDKLYVYGLQCELGVTYPTSYIPTYGSSVTRSADSCSKTGISDLIGQTEGTIYFEIERKDGEYGEPVWLSDGSYSNYILFIVSSTNTRFVGVAGGSQWNMIIPTLSEGVHKIAGAYKQNDIVFYIDGVNRGEDTTANIPTCSLIGLGYENGTIYNNGDPFKQMLLFKTRLSNAELQSLTTL